jgi:hypothetical protein
MSTGLALSISLTGDGGEIPARLLRVLSPERINPVIGQAARNTYREHLFGLNSSRANRLGGKRTNYFAGAARGTSWSATSDTVTVSINQVGIRQRVFGGKITARTSKFLTIPACPEAYGKRAREFGDLKYIIFPKGGPALVRVTGKGDAAKLKVMYWLRRSITQLPDPSVLPYPQLVLTRIHTAVSSTIDRAARRSS